MPNRKLPAVIDPRKIPEHEKTEDYGGICPGRWTPERWYNVLVRTSLDSGGLAVEGARLMLCEMKSLREAAEATGVTKQAISVARRTLLFKADPRLVCRDCGQPLVRKRKVKPKKRKKPTGRPKGAKDKKPRKVSVRQNVGIKKPETVGGSGAMIAEGGGDLEQTKI